MSDSNCFLITQPAYDEVTHYLAVWGQHIVKVANEKGLKTIQLKDDAKRNVLEARLAKNDPRLIAFNGHGKGNVVNVSVVSEVS